MIPEDLAAELDGDWRARLLVTATHTPKALLANALLALRDAPEWKGVLAFDEFALTTMAMRPPPWAASEDNSWTPQRWTDRDDALATEWLHHHHIEVSVNVASTAVVTAAKHASFHPIRDYLTGLEWDGARRVKKFAATYLGAEDTPYHGAVSRCSLVAAVARIMQPGCKVDHVPILESEQGTLKSTAIERMFLPWFSDDLAELGSKDAAMQVRAAWGIEIAELSAMSRGDIERIKAFITRRVDRFRPSYGRHVIEAPRQSVFFGSTNADRYLKDESGGRRFWPLRCGLINVAAIERDRDQLWAEALALFANGTPWWLTNGIDTGLARGEQEDRYVGDPWEQAITEYLGDKDSASIDEILLRVIDKPRDRWTQGDQNRVAACLRAAGFVRRQGPRPDRKWHYRRVSPVEW